MTTQTLIFIIAGLLTTSSVISAFVYRTDYKAIEMDLNEAQSDLDSASQHLTLMQNLVDKMADVVEVKVDDLEDFLEELDSLKRASQDNADLADAERKGMKNRIDSLFKNLSN